MRLRPDVIAEKPTTALRRMLKEGPLLKMYRTDTEALLAFGRLSA